MKFGEPLMWWLENPTYHLLSRTSDNTMRSISLIVSLKINYEKKDTMSKYDRIKQEAYEANMNLRELGLVIFTFGNASAADRDEKVIAIKPSGVPYELLSPESMAVVDFDGIIVEGSGSPSSDTPTHAVLYKQWLMTSGIVHTHSTYATSWAQAKMDIPIYGTTHADHLTSDIPCTPVMSDKIIKGNYEYQTGFQIKDKHHVPEEIRLVIVANHGPFT
jgi:L-ribulose-5-phosphate 4-epimerase